MTRTHICPPDHRHAETLTCYTHHRCGCVDCRAGQREYKYWRNHMLRAGRADTLDSTIDGRGTRRRLHALQALGWSGTVLAHHLGVDDALVGRWSRAEHVTRSTATRVAALYERLSGSVPPARTPAEKVSVTKARRHAARNGWVTPLAWDDIDTDEHPAPTVVVHLDDVDQVAIDLATHGIPTRLTLAERRIVVQQLLDDGYTDIALIARMAGCTTRQVQRIRHTLPSGADEADAA